MRYIKEILKKNLLVTSGYLVIGVFNSFLLNYKADYFQKIIDGLSDGTLTIIGIVAYGIILLTGYVLEYVDEYPAKKLEHGIYLDFKLLALQKISIIEYLEYVKLGTGKLVQKIENGSTAGRDVIFNFWLVLIRQLLPSILFSMYFIAKINRNIMYILMSGYLVVFVVSNVLLKVLMQMKEKVLNHEEMLNHYLIRGFMELVIFRVERQFPNEIRKADDAKREIVSSKVKMNLIHEAFFTIFAWMVAFLNIGIIFYAWKSKNLTAGEVVALISLVENAYVPIAIFNVIYVQYKLDKSAYARFVRFLELKNDEQLQKGKIPAGNAGEICVRNLHFEYEEKTALDEVAFTITRGQKVALVGESGSGKSTLIKILLGFLKYDRGQIKVGGVELRDLCLDKFYDKIVYLSQDSPIFDGTIRENILFDRNVPDDEIMMALEKVNLSCLVRDSAKGLATQIGEKGTRLSGGEKQRLARARLWFEDPELVILDEATSALDNLTEEAVMQEVLDRLKDQTMIVIAHRLNFIAAFDKIIVFRNSKITSQGTFEELMKSDPYFAELYHTSSQI